MPLKVFDFSGLYRSIRCNPFRKSAALSYGIIKEEYNYVTEEESVHSIFGEDVIDR